MDIQMYVFNVYVKIEKDYKEAVASYDTLEEAIAYAKQLKGITEIVVIPTEDPDNDPDVAEWFEYFSEYEPYEVVWSNKIED